MSRLYQAEGEHGQKFRLRIGGSGSVAAQFRQPPASVINFGLESRTILWPGVFAPILEIKKFAACVFIPIIRDLTRYRNAFSVLRRKTKRRCC